MKQLPGEKAEEVTAETIARHSLTRILSMRLLQVMAKSLQFIRGLQRDWKLTSFLPIHPIAGKEDLTKI